jgi:hypothetical protein
LGGGVSVLRVTIFNRIELLESSNLSNSVVSLLNYQGTTLKSHRIGIATGTPVFDISFDSSVLPAVYTLIGSDFSTNPSNAVLSGCAYVSDGVCVLTSNEQYKQGYLLFDSAMFEPTYFDVYWDNRAADGSGADGTSFNYGPMTSASGGEHGMTGAALVVSFVEWGTDRLELRYNGTTITSVPFALSATAYRHIQVKVAKFDATVLVDGVVVISASLSDTSYATTDKTGWRFGFANCTGQYTNKHSIDNFAVT